MFSLLLLELISAFLVYPLIVLSDAPPPQCTNPSATDYSGCGFADPDACLELNRCFIFSAAPGAPPLPEEYKMNSGTTNDWVQQCQCACGDQQALQQQADKTGQATSTNCIGNGTLSPMTSEINVDVGHCACNIALIDELATDIIKALPSAIEIGCFILFGALAIAEVGAQFIPGVGEGVDAGMGFAWTAAKLANFAKGPGQDGLNAFTSFFSPCDASYLPKDMQKVFGILSDITAIAGSPFKPPKGVKPYVAPKPAADPHPPAENHPPPKTAPAAETHAPAETHTPAENHASTSPHAETTPKVETSPKASSPSPETGSHKTTDSSSKHSTTSSSAGLCRRNAGWFGLDRRAPNGCDVTTITKSNPVTVTVTKTCDGIKNPQACAHLYSAGRNGMSVSSIRDWYECTDSQKNGRKLQPRSERWTNIWLKSQHKNAVWRSYTTASYYHTGVKMPVACDRDEWPPAYFLPANAKSKGWAQMVRLLPASENRSTGNVWGAFCKVYDGGIGNGQMTEVKGVPGQSEINRSLVSVKHSRKEVKQGTTTSFLEVDYTRAVFSLTYEWRTGANGLPDPPTQQNDWYLWENPCWPSAIVPHDPGYVLLTQDRWYSTHVFPAAAAGYVDQRGDYNNKPDDNLIHAAAARLAAAPPLQPPTKKRSYDAKSEQSLELLEDGFGVTDFNSSRRLTEEEMLNNLQIVDCADETCSRELKALEADDSQPAGAYIIVSGQEPSHLPVDNNIEQVLTSIATVTEASSQHRVAETGRSPMTPGPTATMTFHA